jgi:hypothetical protein
LGGGAELKRPSDRKGGSDGVETDIIMIRLGEAAVGDVLVKDAEVYRELLHDGNPNACSNGEAEAEVLSLGVRCARGVGKDKADPGFEIRDNGPSFLDKVVSWAKESTGEPGVGTVDYGGIHSAEEEFGVPAVPSLISDFVQLPSHRDELGKITVIVGVIHGEEAGRLYR